LEQVAKCRASLAKGGQLISYWMESLNAGCEKFCSGVLERCPTLRRCFGPRSRDPPLKTGKEPLVKERQSRVERKIGNILEAQEDYIAHQCNCCMHNRTVEGIAKAIYGKYPHANPYTKRDSDPTLIDRPGTANVVKPVVNLYGQFSPGKPKTPEDISGDKWEKQFATAKEAGLLALIAADSSEERLQWFRQSLEGLPEKLRGQPSIAFPSGIGCGLAGGDWEEYLTAIEEFADANPRIRVVIYEFKKAD